MSDLSDRERQIIDLLIVGFRTGAIQKATGAARTTISKCKKYLAARGTPAIANPVAGMQTDTVSGKILKSMAEQALKGGTGAAAAANTVLKHLADSNPVEAGATLEDVIDAIRTWHTDQQCKICGLWIFARDRMCHCADPDPVFVYPPFTPDCDPYHCPRLKDSDQG